MRREREKETPYTCWVKPGYRLQLEGTEGKREEAAWSVGKSGAGGQAGSRGRAFTDEELKRMEQEEPLLHWRLVLGLTIEVQIQDFFSPVWQGGPIRALVRQFPPDFRNKEGRDLWVAYRPANFDSVVQVWI